MYNPSECVSNQEIGLIRTKRRRIEEQTDRVQVQLFDLECYIFDDATRLKIGQGGDADSVTQL